MNLQTSAEVRSHLVRTLEADFVGPFSAATPNEEVTLAPSRWYLTGFLAPITERDLSDDPTTDDDLGAGDDEDDGELPSKEPEPKRPAMMPSSVGLSVLLPAGPSTDTITATISYADYLLTEDQPEPTAADPAQPPTRKLKKSGESKASGLKHRWRRVPRDPAPLVLPLDPVQLRAGVEVPGSGGLRVEGKVEPANAPGLPPGTRALSVFVVNRRSPGEKGRADESYAFQVKLEVRFEKGLTARPNLQGERSDDWDDRVADLQFRDCVEYAVGHGVSVETISENSAVVGARTTWLPQATVRRVVTDKVDGVVRSMDDLASLKDGAAAKASLKLLVDAYGDWIKKQAKIDAGTTDRKATQKELLAKAERAKNRIAQGITLLETDPLALEAFKFANQAMAEAARKRTPERYTGDKRPEWHLFQLGFILMNLPGIVNEADDNRETVELIFFSTGGGKTESYLGLIGFTLVLRRLRGLTRPDKGLGVAVLLRYTLRLLTIDQLGRAATLICALELMRKKQPERLGPVRFSVGLWVGRSATANTLAEVSRKITEYKNDTSKTAASPFPLLNCPWCRAPFKKESLTLLPNKTSPTEVVVGCSYPCDFAPGKNPDGLPVLFVDEQIYRELPSFLVATVDKFAMLPWRGETGSLFGRVQSRTGRRFFGPTDGPAATAGEDRLPDGLLPPELIVQDELHLISGPLGTMVGLYETTIEALCSRTVNGKNVRPKIIASTATVRRASAQVRALFGRTDLALFPPQGVDDSETFFAKVDRVSEGRLYVGVAAAGRPIKAILLRSYVALLAAAQLAFEDDGVEGKRADAYMTLAGYFNSLRELGGMRRLVEDEVRARCEKIEDRRPIGVSGPHPWFRKRDVSPDPAELTSRESTSKIARCRTRLSLPHSNKDHVDVLLASNMISVGVDIERLGLMVVAGQPKSTAEYIQASSRVGRDPERPGLVVTVFNVHRPRDRSHYERFGAYHASFYRSVEATSVTPFSGPALDRGLAGVIVGMTRLVDPALTPSAGAQDLAAYRTTGERAVATLADRAGREKKGGPSESTQTVTGLTQRGKSLLDSWERLVEKSKTGAYERCYSPYDREHKGRPLLFTVLDTDRVAGTDPSQKSDEDKFAAPTSMRDVEPSVHLWIERGGLSREGGRG